MGIKPMTRILDKSGRAEEIYDDIVLEKTMDEVDNKQIERQFVTCKYYENAPAVYACQGAKTQFQISYNGKIYPCGALRQEDYCLGDALAIDNLHKYLVEKQFENTEGYANFKKIHPWNVEKCCECDFNVFCFTCANEIKQGMEFGTLHDNCSYNKTFYDLYWRDYESI